MRMQSTFEQYKEIFGNIRKFLAKYFVTVQIWKKMQRQNQVYCVWLIKWVVKREIIQLTELCLTRWWIISGTWWYWVSIWRYWLVLGQYKLVLLGIRWYMVSKGLVCLYILEKVEIWSGVTDAWQTDRQQKIGLLSFSTVSSLSWVTQFFLCLP